MSNAQCILVIEDETDLRDLIAFNLEREGYPVSRVADGAAALDEIAQKPPSLIILDRMLPVLSGDEVLARLRKDPPTTNLPVIMLTAKADETDELVGFALGADDYISKPFSMKSLMARVGALLRRTDAAWPAVDGDEGEVLTVGPISLDVSRFDVTVNGSRIVLTNSEFRLLHALMKSQGRLLTREQLINEVMGSHVAVVDRTIDVHIAALRKKLGRASKWVQTIRGAGYTFRDRAGADG